MWWISVIYWHLCVHELPIVADRVPFCEIALWDTSITKMGFERYSLKCAPAATVGAHFPDIATTNADRTMLLFPK